MYVIFRELFCNSRIVAVDDARSESLVILKHNSISIESVVDLFSNSKFSLEHLSEIIITSMLIRIFFRFNRSCLSSVVEN